MSSCFGQPFIMLRLVETFFLSCTGTVLDEDETCETFLIEIIFLGERQ